jgi:restriction system protein
MMDRVLDGLLTLARRLPHAVVMGSVIAINSGLLAVAVLQLGTVSIGTRFTVAMMWLGAVSYTILVTIIGVVALFVNSEQWQLLALQRHASDLRSMSWQDFERLVDELLTKQGHRVKRRGGPRPDGGVDLEFSEPYGRCVVQVKKWHWQMVGVSKVRELFGVMHAEGADRAMFVTAGVFSPEAIRFAEGKTIDLIDGHEVWRSCSSTGMLKPPSPRGAQIRDAPGAARLWSWEVALKSGAESPTLPARVGCEHVRQTRPDPDVHRGSLVGDWYCFPFPDQARAQLRDLLASWASERCPLASLPLSAYLALSELTRTEATF